MLWGSWTRSSSGKRLGGMNICREGRPDREKGSLTRSCGGRVVASPGRWEAIVEDSGPLILAVGGSRWSALGSALGVRLVRLGRSTAASSIARSFKLGTDDPQSRSRGDGRKLLSSAPCSPEDVSLQLCCGFAFAASSRVRLSTTEVTKLSLSEITCVFGQGVRVSHALSILGGSCWGRQREDGTCETYTGLSSVVVKNAQVSKGGGNGGSACINGLNASRQTSGNLKNRPQPSEKLPGSFTEPNTSLSCSRPRPEEEKQFSDGTCRIACWTRTY